MYFRIARHLFVQRNTARHGLLKRPLTMLLSSCGMFTLMVTCTPFYQVSANMLSVSIIILQQYAPVPRVSLSFDFHQGISDGHLEGNLSMACEGHIVPAWPDSQVISLPREGAGGTYHCVYTDEHGSKIPLLVPIPPGTLAITSPTAGATIQLAESTSPTPTTSPTPGPRPLALTSTVTIRYTLPTLPSGASGQAVATALCGGSCPTPRCRQLLGDKTPAIGTCTITDAGSVFGSGFETFLSGSLGSIQLSTRFSWSPPASGFNGVHVAYEDSINIPVSWSR